EMEVQKKDQPEEEPGKKRKTRRGTRGRGRKIQYKKDKAGSTVKPSVSLLPPSSLQLSGGSASLLCLLSGYSPQGAQVSWTVGGSEVKEGVLTSGEEEKNGRYSRSSTLTLSKARWDQGEEVVWYCNVGRPDAGVGSMVGFIVPIMQQQMHKQKGSKNSNAQKMSKAKSLKRENTQKISKTPN
ncbi:hypothetical protein NFI96_006199, partial [Prochilodus magdalenae]